MSHPEVRDEDSDYCGPDDWYWELQSGRLYIADRVVYKRLSPALKANGVFDGEDDEEITHQNPTEKGKANHMVDKLLRKGEENYEKFLKIVAVKYPDVYRSVTKKEPPAEQPDDIKDPSDGPTNEKTIVDIVLERLEEKKAECEKLANKNLILKTEYEDRVREIECQKIRIEEMLKRAERYESMERDMTALKDVVDQVKSENFRVCMMIVNANEENAKRREEIMATQVENDRLKAELKKMASTVNSERSVSVRLRRRIETGPSEKVIRGLQQEIDELKLKLAQTSRKSSGVENDADTRVQILQSDKEEAIQMYAEATEKLNKLREEFNNTETLRDKYLEENDYLKLQVSALTDDCEMYKTRQDANWHKLQEVEKERDQLMKERNEAQITAQNHMDEKTKYRAEIRKLEKTQDDLSHKMREKDTQCRDLTNKLKKYTSKPPGADDENHSSDTSTATTEKSAENGGSPWRYCRRDRAHNTKHFPEFVGKSEFDGTIDSKNSRIGADGVFPEIPLVANYGVGCGKFEPRRRVGRRRKNDSRSKRMNSETLSKTSSTDSEYQRRQEDADLVMAEINAKTVQECVKFIGGNCSGIFINQVLETQNCTTNCRTILPGMLLRKIRQPQMKALNVNQWTLEYHNNVIRSIEGTVVFLLEQKQKEYNDLKDKLKNSKMTGDSFYVRANFKWSRENMLNFNKFDILHVINTQPSTEMHWLACKIDPYNGNNAFRCDVIPSYKYCIEHPLQAELLQKTRRNTEPTLFPPEMKDAPPLLQQSSSTKTPKCTPTPCYHPLVLGRTENCLSPSYEPIGKPYTILQPVHLPKDRPRPCLLLPLSLSKIISFKLTTIAEPMLFDFPVPESLNCAIDMVRSRLYDKDVVSFNSVSVDSQELVTTNSVQRTADMGKHCILSINDNCISIKDYLKKLQSEDIYPIVIFLHAERQRTVKLFIDSDQCRPNIVIQDMLLTGEQLKRFGMNYSSVNLERCNKVEDGVQLLIKKIADETNRVVWKEEAGDICI